MTAQGRDREIARVTEHALLRKQEQSRVLVGESRKPIVFVMGDDDGILGQGLAWTSEGMFVDINQRRARFGRTNPVGYHLTSPFVGGTFERILSQQRQDFSRLRGLIDDNTILVTHGRPSGILDVGSDGQHYGSRALRELVDSALPRLHLFGHTQRSHGVSG